jgi:hypothetical protein
VKDGDDSFEARVGEFACAYALLECFFKYIRDDFRVRSIESIGKAVGTGALACWERVDDSDDFFGCDWFVAQLGRGW